MIQSTDRYERLFAAGELIYKFKQDEGFYSGKDKDPESDKMINTWNKHAGAKRVIEQKLGRPLSKAEVTMLSLAIGYGPTPDLTTTERKEAFTELWPDGPDGSCHQFMRLVIAI